MQSRAARSKTGEGRAGRRGGAEWGGAGRGAPSHLRRRGPQLALRGGVIARVVHHSVVIWRRAAEGVHKHARHSFLSFTVHVF